MKKKTQMIAKLLLTTMVALAIPQANAADKVSSYSIVEQQKEIQVEGRVVDAQGNPLLGVNVLVKGSQRGVATDKDGYYTLRVDENAVLVFKSLGFHTQEIPVQGRMLLNVQMKVSQEELPEVTVTSTGIKRQIKDFAGTVNVVSAAQIKELAIPAVGDAVRFMPGVNYIDEDGRIHGSFNQTITATGRLSSTDPNLQNIPIRTEMGSRIRDIFVPREGYVFVDADYSQIELRVLASMSDDEKLIESYKKSEDIHAITASEVFHVPLDKVDATLRRNAKAVNFGVVYGISAFGLSEGLSISRKEALEYINNYFKSYPKVKEFLDRQVKEAKEKGYVRTLYNRIRPIPEIKSSNFMQRAFGDRVAMNSPIQGTAADIMKKAMLDVDKALKKYGDLAYIVLQVHDELLIEVKEENAKEVRDLVEKTMKAACKLAVELEVEAHIGRTWLSAK